jgi:hypothetical protein
VNVQLLAISAVVRRWPRKLRRRSTVAVMQRIPQIGDRVRITGLMNDPDPLTVGEEGTVNWLGSWDSDLTKQISVKWDSGRTLNLLENDPFEIL